VAEWEKEINQLFRVYSRQLLYGVGRFLVVTTSQYDENGKNITAEVFVFAYDTAPEEKRFNIGGIKYTENPELHAPNIDLEYIERLAQQKAKNIICAHQLAEYRKTKEIEYIRDRPIELSRCDNAALIDLKYNGYEAELKKDAEHSKSEELRKLINVILNVKMEIFDID
jgi:hypothetical protein